MKCKSCGALNPPEFVWAIQNNVCAGCGSALLDDQENELLAELTAAMERMPNNPQGIAGWFLSNYRFVKVGDGVPTEKFYAKGQPGQPQSNNPVNNFLQRSNAYKTISETNNKVNSKFAAMAEAIASGNIDENMYGNGSSDIAPPQEEDVEIDDDNEIVAQPVERPSRALLTGAELLTPGEHLSEEEVKEVFIAAGGLDPEEMIAEDPVATKKLHEQRMKRVRSQQNFSNGIGLIRRGED